MSPPTPPPEHALAAVAPDVAPDVVDGGVPADPAVAAGDAPVPSAHAWSTTTQVGDLLRRLSLDLHRYVHLVARRLGMPPTDVHAVGVLQACDEPVSAAALGRALGLTPSATTSLIERLRATDHAVRRTASGDARRAAIEPTALATEHSAREFEPLTHAIHEALDACDAADVAAFHRVLRAVQASMHRATEHYSRQ